LTTVDKLALGAFLSHKNSNKKSFLLVKKGAIVMSTKCTLSFHMGSRFNEKHNNRTIPVPHADCEYEEIHNWYHPHNMCLEQAYEFFSESFNEYNSSIRKDRQYNSYLEKLQIAQQKEQEKLSDLRHAGASASEIRKHRKAVKPAYEIIIGLGNMRDNPELCKGGELQNTAKAILVGYVKQFEKENPNVILYNASIHTGENGSIHLHADVIFWAECSRGQKKQASLTKALAAMGYESDKEKGPNGKRMNAITKWEMDQRDILRTLCAQRDITIIDGKHSKHHLTTEEYQIQQDGLFLEQQAQELLLLQDKYIDSVAQDSDSTISYLKELENEELRKVAEQYEAMKHKTDKLLTEAWAEFNSATSTYFEQYRVKKKRLSEEIIRARQGANDSRKRLNAMLKDLAYSNEFFLIKLVKLVVALFLAIDNACYENQVERLQKANTALKQQAKEIMKQSNNVSTVLKSKELDTIEEVLSNYDTLLQEATHFTINRTKDLETNTNHNIQR
jgi:hypothetical protein